jgi:hypothetical protein
MAIIKISELRPAGSELFQDSESFMNELTERDIAGVEGGGFLKNGSIGITISAQTVVGNTVNANTKGNINTVVIA